MRRTRRRPDHSTHAFGAWILTPEGAALHPGERTAVIADVHLGYEWARGAAGDCVPAHSLDETLTRLSRLFDRVRFRRLIVAGDLIESARPCRRTAADLQGLHDWLKSRAVTLLALEGNHDRGRLVLGTSARGDSRPRLSCVVDGWTIVHGDQPNDAEKTVSGHHHPVIRTDGISAPCFLAGPDRIVLPAFSPNAAGCDVLNGPIPPEWLDGALRCIASTGSDLLDFGPVSSIRRGRWSPPRSKERQTNA
jgi:uncharacterized protein